MIILEIFLVLFVIAMISFGKIEVSSQGIKLSVSILGQKYPLFSIVRKKDTDGSGGNVSL